MTQSLAYKQAEKIHIGYSIMYVCIYIHILTYSMEQSPS